MASAERESVTGVYALCPQRSPGDFVPMKPTTFCKCTRGGNVATPTAGVCGPSAM